jgi:hypothetical protein
VFDLREDQLVEAMATYGIRAGGEILGEFVWGVLGSSTRLVLHGGKLWTSLTDQTEKKKNESYITRPVPGHVYVHPGSDPLIFVGRVRVPNVSELCWAFVELDEVRPWSKKYTEEELRNVEDHRASWIRDYQNIMDSWPSLTFSQKFQWTFVTNLGHSYWKDHRQICNITKSVLKLTQDLGCIESEQLALLRTNTLVSTLRYVDGFGSSWVKEPNRWGSVYATALDQDYIEFAKKLVWVDR